MDRLAVITSSIKHDNVDVQLYGLLHLSSLLQTEKELFQACIGEKDHVEPIIREIMDALLSGCRDEDENIRLACADCIGAVGALDPGLLSWRELQSEKEALPLGADTDGFISVALIHLARSFQQCRETQTMDAFSLAMQELLKLFKISPDEKSPKKNIWGSFPREVQEIMTPLLSSCYKNSIGPNVQMPHPVIGSKYGMTLNDWACNWTFVLLDCISGPCVQAVFDACAISLKRDLQTLLFFMPYILLHAVLSASPVNIKCFLEEMLAVMDTSSHIPQPSHDDEQPSYAIHLSGSRTVATEGLNADTRMMCAKTVFTLIDFVWRFTREWISAHYLSSNLREDPVYVALKAFVSEISALKIALSNIECGEYPRALMYLEMFISKNPQQFQEQLWLFMKIYARLNEPDAVHGIMATREQEPSLEELIIVHEVTGQLQDAVACYERLAQDETRGPDFYKGMVQCYLGLDQPITSLRIAQGIVSERPEMARVMQEFEAEAFWRLQMFDDLGSLLSSPEIAENKAWGVQAGRALLHFQAGRSTVLHKHLKCMRMELLDGLRTVSLEKGSYQEEYQSIVRLHILNEMQRTEEVVQAILKNVSNDQQCMLLVEQLMHEWEDRLKNVQQFSRAKEPVLSMRRTVLVLAKSLIEEKLPEVAKYLDKEVGRCWLQSAVTARKDGLYQQAYTYILNAEKFHLKELFVEKAKLYWEKGEQDPAFLTLRRGLEEHFTNVENPDSCFAVTGQSDSKICAEAKLLMATYNDETVNVDMDVNICNYKQAVDACRQWEKSSVCLAQYYDRVLGVMTDEERNTRGGDIQVNMVNFYGKSLRYGCNYIYQSMPRMLSIWLDFGTSVAEAEKEKDRTRAKMEVINDMKTNLDKMTKIVDQLVEELPPYMFLTAFSQLVSRICHPHPDVFRHLKTIIVYMLLVYSQQSLWMLMPVYKSSSSFRVKRCEEVLNDPIFKNTTNAKLLNDFTRLTEKLIELTEKPIGNDVKYVTVSSLVSSLPRLLKSPDFSDIMMPCQQFTIIQLPTDDNRIIGHDPFPVKQVFIKEVCDELTVLPSLQKPRRISFVGSDGNQYMMMCKAKDDLRKDFRFMEFNNVVNRYLRKDPESRQRGLHIRTYHVVPLNEECGIVEWVPKLVAYRNIIIRLYKEAGNYTNNKQLKELSSNLSDSHSAKREKFERFLIPKHPPVFDEWFRSTFPEPYAWYRARTSYIRTTAVMSMVGYMLGLGDRHGENILFDTVSGETVHVDFNCIFNKGENFTWPERVPFRLTHNMVAAMGPLGVEGMFRRSCEITLRILRAQSETLMSVLRPFVYDPMVTWRSTSTSARPAARKESVETTNELAMKNLEDIEGRVQGMVRIKGSQCSTLALSVEGQANNLILEATNIDNLCEMYIGWGPFM
ncbi:Serine/threonine-protein kinase ATR [Zootermopsis nevadensis]|uniref:Serine/threonine-protein kinase ATR n=2 Tax=Zootermopsis nevadensis TaxID=136037 RepID=A0A067R2F2_ZOONE|nr:Serine/threonine-protein kinase ATR [Zootermopsis nevadensis]